MEVDCARAVGRVGDEWEAVVVHRAGGDLAVLRPFRRWEGFRGDVRWKWGGGVGGGASWEGVRPTVRDGVEYVLDINW